MKLNEDVFDDVLHMEIPNVETEISIDEVTPSAPAIGVDTGVANILMDLVKDEYEAIQGYNNFLANLNGHEEMRPIIEDILKEENTHVGQLQELLKTISPNAGEIETGTEEAKEQIVDKGYPMDESFLNKIVQVPTQVSDTVMDVSYCMDDVTTEIYDYELVSRSLTESELEQIKEYIQNHSDLRDETWEYLNEDFFSIVREAIRHVVPEIVNESLKLKESFINSIVTGNNPDIVCSVEYGMDDLLNELYSESYGLASRKLTPEEMEDVKKFLRGYGEDWIDEETLEYLNDDFRGVVEEAIEAVCPNVLQESVKLKENFLNTIVSSNRDPMSDRFPFWLGWTETDIDDIIENVFEVDEIDYELSDQECQQIYEFIRGCDISDDAYEELYDELRELVEAAIHEVLTDNMIHQNEGE